ncbi:MAG: hypothetical protein ACYTG6_13025 [Planctomycetota bacterium]|jgi:hypothetical protein
MASIVLGVLAAAHLGLFLLLTTGARQELDRIDARWTPSELEAAQLPGPRPSSGGSAMSRWNAAQALWEDAEARSRHQRHVRIVGYGLLVAFLVQVAVTGVLLSRVRRRIGA